MSWRDIPRDVVHGELPKFLDSPSALALSLVSKDLAFFSHVAFSAKYQIQNESLLPQIERDLASSSRLTTLLAESLNLGLFDLFRFFVLRFEYKLYSNRMEIMLLSKILLFVRAIDLYRWFLSEGLVYEFAPSLANLHWIGASNDRVLMKLYLENTSTIETGSLISGCCAFGDLETYQWLYDLLKPKMGAPALTLCKVWLLTFPILTSVLIISLDRITILKHLLDIDPQEVLEAAASRAGMSSHSKTSIEGLELIIAKCPPGIPCYRLSRLE